MNKKTLYGNVYSEWAVNLKTTCYCEDGNGDRQKDNQFFIINYFQKMLST